MSNKFPNLQKQNTLRYHNVSKHITMYHYIPEYIDSCLDNNKLFPKYSKEQNDTPVY